MTMPLFNLIDLFIYYFFSFVHARPIDIKVAF